MQRELQVLCVFDLQRCGLVPDSRHREQITAYSFQLLLQHSGNGSEILTSNLDIDFAYVMMLMPLANLNAYVTKDG